MCLDFSLLVLVFISLGCLEHVEIAKNLAQNRSIYLLSIEFFFFKRYLSIEIYINKYLTGLNMFSVKGSTSIRSWLVHNPFLTSINDTIKYEDDISLSYQSADSSRSKAFPKWGFVVL